MTALKKPLSCIMAFMLIFAFVLVTPVTVFATAQEAPAEAEAVNELDVAEAPLSAGVALTAAPLDDEFVKPEVLNKKTDGDFEYIKIDNDTSIEIVGYLGNDTTVSVPSKINSVSVTSVGDYCFYGNTSVEKIKLNSGITSVGEFAFANCTALKEVTEMDSLTSFGVSAFEGCTSMEEFKLPDMITAVPEKCFAGCTALAEVKYHKNLKNCAKDAFLDTAWENNAPDGALNLGRVLYSYKGDVADLVIGEGIEIIESYVFMNCDKIKTVTFGEDVEEIGLYAFQNCTNLESASFGTAVSIVDAGAFKGCSSLKVADFSNCTIATVGYEAFADCASLGEVKFSDTLTDIGDRAFARTQIKTVAFGKSVENVGPASFTDIETLEGFEVSSKNKNFSSADGVLYSANGKSLIVFPAAKTGSFELPAKVEEIKNSAFKNSDISEVVFTEDTALRTVAAYAFANSKLEKITLPETVTVIENSAFKDSASLKDLKLGSKVTYIGASAFENCASLAVVTLPDTLRDIASCAFKNAGLTGVNLGDGVIRIDSEAFAGNKKLTDLYLGSRVEKIGECAFSGCENLAAVTLPASLKQFGADAFVDCSALKSIKVDEANTSYKNVGSAVYSADGKTLVIVPVGTVACNIAKGTEVIGSSAFCLAPALANITFPTSLKNVEDSALHGTAWYKAAKNGAVYAGNVLYAVNGEMASLLVKSGTVAIADNAVNNSSVKSVALPNSLIAIGEDVFGASEIKSIYIPDSVTEIGDRAFENAIFLRKVTFGKSAKLTSLGNAAFKWCEALTDITLPASLKEVPADAFAECTSLKTVGLASVEKIGKYAFSGCTALEKIVLPATLTELDPLSFLGCVNFDTVEVEEGSTYFKTIDGAVFALNEDGSFDTLVLYPQGKDGAFTMPEEAVNIGDRAFYDCDGLTAVTFHGGVKNIGAEAFFDCDALTAVNMPDSVRKIGSYAFGSCNELREFVVNSNLTDYEDNAFDGCYYFNYDAVTINVPDNSGMILGIIVGIFVLVGVVWYLVYQKKQKKLEKEFIAKKAAEETK